MEADNKRPLDTRFLLLSALGMIFVVDGHVNSSYLDLGGFFPYYSFHMPLFFFISGCFYRDSYEDEPLAFIKRKFFRLLVPCLLWNLVYGAVAWLLHQAGFSMGDSFSLHNLLIEPFITGHQFAYNLAAWFVPALFFTETACLLLRRGLRRWIRNEFIYTALFLALGILGVHMAMSGLNSGAYLPLVRTMFTLPFYQLGILYRRRLEPQECKSSLLYFAVVFLVQFCLHLTGAGLVYETAFCRGFSGPIVPYIAAAAGIAFWLRVAKILAPAFEKNPILIFFGRHTYAVMMHHLMALMTVKGVIAVIAKCTPLFAGFRFDLFKTDLWYYYYPGQSVHFRIVYLFAAIALPLLFQYVWEQKLGPVLKEKFAARRRSS